MSRWSDIMPPETVQVGNTLYKKAYDEVQAGKILYPPVGKIFAALNLTPPEQTKVIILGQDPYHGQGQANGLAFSVAKDMPLPPSLQNIYKELMDDIGCPRPSCGDLSPWAKQGVLLLNTTLTVWPGQPASCADWGWNIFTQAVCETALQLPQPIVFLLWGSHARNVMANITNKLCPNGWAWPNKVVITSSHPSPMGAYTASRTAPAFMGSKPFSRANAALTQLGAAPVDWRLP